MQVSELDRVVRFVGFKASAAVSWAKRTLCTACNIKSLQMPIFVPLRFGEEYQIVCPLRGKR